MILELLTTGDNVEAVCAQMQPDLWGKDNEMTSYQPDKLKAYLQAGGVLILAKDGEKIAGAALCYLLPHPAGDDSLYVHELDTHPDYRRQNVATKLMQEAQKIAKEKNCTEVWVGTEATNTAADTFYRSLDPYEIEPSVIYAYKVK
jgi:ribosomal protein S18 acetylase RimI-like enzyme